MFSFNSELETLRHLNSTSIDDNDDFKKYKDLEKKFEIAKSEVDNLKKRIDNIRSKIADIDERKNKRDELKNSLSAIDNNKIEEDSVIKKQMQVIEKFIDYKKYDELKESLDVLIEKLNKAENKYFENENNLLIEERTISFDRGKINKYNEALDLYFKSLQNINKLNNLHQRLLKILYSDESWEVIEEARDRFVNDISKSKTGFTSDDLLKYCQKKLDSVDVQFHNLSKAYSELDPTTLKKNEIIKHFTEISTIYKQLPKNSYRLFFAQIIKVFDAINKSNFNLTYRTLVVSDNADVIKYSLKGIPHSNLPFSVETKEITLNYDVRIKGGIKIDVSTGIFWNVGLIDRTFRFEDVDSSSDTDTEDKVRVIRETNDNLFVPSFGILFHLYRRSYNSVKLGVNIGASTNTDRVNYYLGGSLLVGKSQRINFNFGIVGAQVTEATDMFDTEEPITAPGDLTTVPTQRPFRLGLYTGVTFNLIGNSNKQALDQVRSQITKL